MSGAVLDAASESPEKQMMRVYCTVHSLGFPAPRARHILCENGHELDHNFPHAEIWEYCCDCQSYVQSNFVKGGKAAGECLVCDRKIARRYVCGECHVVSYESDQPARGKSFTMSAKGSPQPACPGCSRVPPQRLRRHSCEQINAFFTAGRDSCPFCQEAIPLPVSFPISVAEFFRGFKGEQITVKHNAPEWLLVESEAGEFVVIPRGNDTNNAIVLPKTTRFATPSDFTTHYKDYYDCSNPIAGEVVILSPAVVKEVDGGWKIAEVGKLETKSDITSHHVASPTMTFNTVGETQPHALAQTTICPVCNKAGKPSHKFCKSCGARLSAPFATAPLPARQTGELPPSNYSMSGYTGALSSTGNTPQVLDAGLPVAPEVLSSTDGTQSFASRKVKIVGIACVALIALTLGFGIMLRSGTLATTTESRLEAAIAQGSLFTPSSDSAYYYYSKLKQNGANASQLARYDEKLLPLLTTRPQQMLNDLMNNFESAGSPLTEWQDAQKSMSWASEIRPADKTLAAKAAYCKGRVFYLQERWDDAIEAWTQASKLDPSWALPPNGIGLIYNIKKSYSIARPYLKEAIRISPSWAVPYNNMGTSYILEKNYSQAETYYEQAKERAPRWARPYAWLGDIAAERNDYCRASEMYKAAISREIEGMSNWNSQRMQRKAEEAAAKCNSPR